MPEQEFAQTLSEIRHELDRIGARDVRVQLAPDFEPQAGTLVRIDYHGAYWHMLPPRFAELLRELPAGAGGSGVRQAIAREGHGVWHGPSPSEARDTLT